MFDAKSYQVWVLYRNFLAHYEHRLDGHRVILKPNAHEIVPLADSGPWTPSQVSRLIEHDLIETSREPFKLPPSKNVQPPTDNSQDHNFIHVDWMTLPFTGIADAMFDGNKPGGYRFQTFDDNAILAHLVAKAGAFKSGGDARRNGWDKPIPPGFSEFTVGKRKIQVTILNKAPRMFDPVED